MPILSKHDSEKHEKCPHCDFHTWSLRGIQVHIDGHHTEHYPKQFNCNHCTRRFVFEISLKTHLNKMQTRKQLSCKFCGIQVLKIKELESHVLEVHPESRNSDLKGNPTELALLDTKVKDKVFCEICNGEVECLETLKSHKLQHQDGKDKCCVYCDYKNRTWENLKSHIEGNHPEHGEKKNLCDLCGKGFIFQSSCKKHKLLYHQKKSCHICGVETFNNASLKDHLSSVHKFEEITVHCKFCPFTANSKGTLKTHIAAKHRVENHKQCPYCEYHTHKIHRIQVHIDSKHPEHDKKQF